MKRSIILLGLVLSAQFAFAAGYEKSIMFGGQTSGVAGIGTPYMQGSQAIYFNPAGLATDKEGKDAAFNLSVTSSKFSSPITSTNSNDDSKTSISTPISLMYGQTINKDLGVGIGIYTPGGNYASYEDLVLGGGAIKGTFNAKTDLKLYELAIGAGYKILDNLKVGIAYRISMAQAEVQTIKPVNATTFAQVALKDLKDTNYQGYKLGAQYTIGKTDIGFSYRSETVFHAKGTQEVTVHNLASANALGTSTTGVTLGTLFPASWTLGARHACTETWNVLAEYNFTEYSKVDNISTQTDAGVSTPLVTKWKDQHLIRLAGEYTGMMMPIRFGYIYGTPVTNKDYFFPTVAAPGPAHVVTLGTGYNFGMAKVDGGFEYNTVKGSFTGKDAESSTNAMSVHLGVAMNF